MDGSFGTPSGCCPLQHALEIIIGVCSGIVDSPMTFSLQCAVKGTVTENSDFSLVDLVAGVWSWSDELHMYCCPILLIFKSVMSCPRQLHFNLQGQIKQIVELFHKKVLICFEPCRLSGFAFLKTLPV